MKSPIVEYFGELTVAATIADYFKNNGTTEKVRDDLMLMALIHPDRFFDLVDKFIMRNEKIT